MMNQFIVADGEKCIGCRTCEIACAIAHSDIVISSENFTPRLMVIKGATITIPVVCHHCDNAPCMEACATNAIVMRQDSVQVVQELCIGCKSCVVACPFGAISVVNTARGIEALKCDLCIDQAAGPTCVTVCPTNALSLVKSIDLRQQVKEKQRQTALAALL